jgi:hypothetical protein
MLSALTLVLAMILTEPAQALSGSMARIPTTIHLHVCLFIGVGIFL